MIGLFRMLRLHLPLLYHWSLYRVNRFLIGVRSWWSMPILLVLSFGLGIGSTIGEVVIPSGVGALSTVTDSAISTARPLTSSLTDSASSITDSFGGRAVEGVPAGIIADRLGVLMATSLRSKLVAGWVDSPQDLAWSLSAPYIPSEGGRRGRIGGEDKEEYSVLAGDLGSGVVGDKIGDAFMIRGDSAAQARYRRSFMEAATNPTQARVEVFAVYVSSSSSGSRGLSSSLSVRLDAVGGLTTSGGVSLLLSSVSEWGEGSRHFVGSILSGRPISITDGQVIFLDDVVTGSASAVPSTVTVNRAARSRRVGQLIGVSLGVVKGGDWVGALTYTDSRAISADSAQSTDLTFPVVVRPDGEWSVVEYDVSAARRSRLWSYIFPLGSGGRDNQRLVLGLRLLSASGSVPVPIELR